MIMFFVSSRVLEKISTMFLTALTSEPKISKSAIKGQRFKYDLRSFLMFSYSKSNYVGLLFTSLLLNICLICFHFYLNFLINYPRESSPLLWVRALTFFGVT